MIQVPQEYFRTVEVPIPVERSVERIIERIEHVHVPVRREEHIMLPPITSQQEFASRLPPRFYRSVNYVDLLATCLKLRKIGKYTTSRQKLLMMEESVIPVV